MSLCMCVCVCVCVCVSHSDSPWTCLLFCDIFQLRCPLTDNILFTQVNAPHTHTQTHTHVHSVSEHIRTAERKAGSCSVCLSVYVPLCPLLPAVSVCVCVCLCVSVSRSPL